MFGKEENFDSINDDPYSRAQEYLDLDHGQARKLFYGGMSEHSDDSSVTKPSKTNKEKAAEIRQMVLTYQAESPK